MALMSYWRGDVPSRGLLGLFVRSLRRYSQGKSAMGFCASNRLSKADFPLHHPSCTTPISIGGSDLSLKPRYIALLGPVGVISSSARLLISSYHTSPPKSQSPPSVPAPSPCRTTATSGLSSVVQNRVMEETLGPWKRPLEAPFGQSKPPKGLGVDSGPDEKLRVPSNKST